MAEFWFSFFSFRVLLFIQVGSPSHLKVFFSCDVAEESSKGISGFYSSSLVTC